MLVLYSMPEPYRQSAVLIYQSNCATSLNGTVISFFEIQEKPIMFSFISKNLLSIFLVNPFYSINSFLENIPFLMNEVENPIYLFQYDLYCLERYDNEYKTRLIKFFSNFKQEIITDNRFKYLEDFYSFALPECYYSFFNFDMYKRFCLTKDFFELTTFARSILFSKVVLIIDKYSIYVKKDESKTNISITSSGVGPITLPSRTCLIDIQTEGLKKSSNILLMTIYKERTFNTYYLNKLDKENQDQFREFIKRSLARFKIIYVFNINFEKNFFPEINDFVDIKFTKYNKFAAARKIVHLPYHHLEFDPGNGKNVPIWSKLSQIEENVTWKTLILNRTITNILTKLAILSSNEIKIPFSDPIMADARRLIPSIAFLDNFDKKNCLLKKRVFYYPIKHFNEYHFADGKYSEMYLDNID